VPDLAAIAPADADLHGVAPVYEAVGFRPDLVDDLGFLRSIGGTVFVARDGEEVVGVSSCMPFGATGWVGGVAVRPDHGRRGLGGALTRRAMDELERGGATGILLQATVAGRPLYERMGFQAEGEYAEFHGPAVAGEAPDAVRAADVGEAGDVLALDGAATGEDRGRVIRALWPRGGRVVRGDGGLLGYGLRQVEASAGAVIATSRDAGEALLRTGLTGAPGADRRVAAPVAHEEVRQLLEGLGFEERTRTMRMHLGTAPSWRADRIFSAFNLYWG
jgi:ribosomal protein S18 acetylase RimI-like enzyme